MGGVQKTGISLYNRRKSVEGITLNEKLSCPKYEEVQAEHGWPVKKCLRAATAQKDVGMLVNEEDCPTVLPPRSVLESVDEGSEREGRKIHLRIKIHLNNATKW